MTANTVMLTFNLPVESLESDETWNKLKGLGGQVYNHQDGDKSVIHLGGPHDVLYVWTGPNGSHCTARIYSHGLVTLDIQYCLMEKYSDHSKHPYDIVARPVNPEIRIIEGQFIKSLQQKLKEYLHVEVVNSLYTPVKRGDSLWRYTVSEDDRLMEYDFTDILVDKESQYQRITIFQSKQFGNMLYLDEDAMLAEKDFIYTQTLCGLDQEDYMDKEVLILGGGDGGVLHELLKCNPKYVTMAEYIDEEVIKACRVHMRKVCGDAMDKFEGANYKILIEDCVEVLKEYIQSGKKFDYVINDLTERTIGESSKTFVFDFLTTSQITELSLQVLKPDAKLMARGCANSSDQYREHFQDDLKKLGCSFVCKTVFVPSFLEDYNLYEIQLKA